MELYYIIMAFIFGSVLGSFYNVVGYRLPRGESLLFPSSHCTNCNHKLGASELVPIFSFLFQKGKCKKCHHKISWFYPCFELCSGLLFVISYLVFGLTIELVIALTFISILLIIIISDYQTMIIPDEVLIAGLILLVIEFGIQSGFHGILISLGNGLIAFFCMWGLKKIGDFLFKRESMGGGDIKLMFLFGMIFGWKTALISIFLASFIGLPISLIFLYSKKDTVIPFGPFLAASAILLLLTQFQFDFLIELMTR